MRSHFPARTRSLVLLGSLALCSGTWSLAAAEKDDENVVVIDLDRAMKPGDGFFEDTTLKIKETQIESNETGETTSSLKISDIVFQADQLVLTSTPKGYASGLLIRIEKLALTPFKPDSNPDTEKVLLEKDTWITAEAGKDGVIFKRFDGTLIEDEQTTESLDELIGLAHQDPKASQNECLAVGKDHPRKPGETWELDPVVNALSMSRPDSVVQPSDVAGYAVFLGQVDSRGRQCLRLSYSNSIDVTRHQNQNAFQGTNSRTTYHRNITIDLPVEGNPMESRFTLQRWMRHDVRRTIKDRPTAPSTSSRVAQLDYETNLDPLEGERLDAMEKKRLTMPAPTDDDTPAGPPADVKPAPVQED